MVPPSSSSPVLPLPLCEMCSRPGSSQFQLMEGKTFCSERCLTLCRRAAFKRNKVCDGCNKSMTNTTAKENKVLTLSGKDGQIQFCR